MRLRNADVFVSGTSCFARTRQVSARMSVLFLFFFFLNSESFVRPPHACVVRVSQTRTELTHGIQGSSSLDFLCSWTSHFQVAVVDWESVPHSVSQKDLGFGVGGVAAARYRPWPAVRVEAKWTFLPSSFGPPKDPPCSVGSPSAFRPNKTFLKDPSGVFLVICRALGSSWSSLDRTRHKSLFSFQRNGKVDAQRG